jgi:TonB family protein
MTAERKSNWADEVADRLLKRAARRAPTDLSARLEEEWRADMAERDVSWSRLRFAVGCCWAVSVIAREYSGAALPAATAAGQGQFIGYAAHAPFFSRRGTTFLVVVGLHAAVLFALVTMHSKFMRSDPQNITVRTIDEVRRAPLPLPRQQIFDSKIPILPPENPPRFDTAPDEVVQTVLREPPPATETAEPPQVKVARLRGGPGNGFPSADDFYPSVALHMGEQGVATVRACVDARGRLTDEPTIVESSGSRRLDEGAIKLAKAASGHYRASSEDGRAVDSCYPFRVRFSLK